VEIGKVWKVFVDGILNCFNANGVNNHIVEKEMPMTQDEKRGIHEKIKVIEKDLELLKKDFTNNDSSNSRYYRALSDTLSTAKRILESGERPELPIYDKSVWRYS
jgi:hypothetical protein